MVWALLTFMAAQAQPTAKAEQQWLVIGAAGAPLQPVLARRASIAKTFPDALIAKSDDCRNLKRGLFLLVATRTSDRKTADEQLAKLKPLAADAYVRHCELRSGSLLAFDIPAVHPSIESVPSDAVNWEDSDRTSELRPLDRQGFLLVERTYRTGDDSTREGRVEKLYFLPLDGKTRKLIEPDCFDIGFAQMSGRLLAFSCATETRAEEMIHTTKVYDVTVRSLGDVASHVP